MKNTLLLIFLIPVALFAQDRANDGLYSSPFSRTINTSTVSRPGNPVPAMYAAGIKIAGTADLSGFPAREPLKVYPNPAVSDTRAVFSSRENGLDYYYTMTSQDGKNLLQGKGKTVKGTNIIRLNLGNYPMGTYFLRLMVDQRKETATIVKVSK